MKKYLMTIAAAAMCAAFTSCSHDFDFDQAAQEDRVQSKYDQAFLNYIGGTIDPDQDWGFSATRGITRGADFNLPGNTSFRDNLTTAIPTISMPDFPDELPASGVTYAKNVTDWNNAKSVYIDAAYSSVDQNANSVKIYVNGNVEFSGTISNNGDGWTFIVLKDKKLTLKSWSGQNMKVYLAPGAILDITNAGLSEFDPNSKAGIYMKSLSKVKAKTLDFFGGWKVLNQGGTIEAENIYLQKPGTVLWNEGTITVSGEIYTQNEQAKIYNAQGHKIKAAKLTLHNNSELLYNDGEVEITGAIATENNGGEIINNGSLSGASLSLKAGGKMHNVGTTNITGKTHIANSQTEWKNEGQFNTGDFEVSDYAEKVYNNCKLTVHKANNTGEFKIYGKFVLEGGDPSGASVVTDKVYWVNNSFVFLGSKSLFKVNGQFLTANYDINGGMVGYGNDYAVVQAESIVRPSEYANKQFGMTYKGKLFVDAGTHFAQGAEDPQNNPPAQPYYKYDNTVKFKHLKDASPVSIPSSNCNPGYNTTEEVYDLKIIAEDLSAQGNSDFDFNDIVLEVKYGSPAKIKLTHAGGTLPLVICGSETTVETVTQDYEVHDLFGVGRNEMVNTGRGPVCSPVLLHELTTPLRVNIANAKEANEKLKLFVYKEKAWHEMKAPKGEPACKLAVGIDYPVLRERDSIKGTYKFFEGWANGTNFVSEWWKAENQ